MRHRPRYRMPGRQLRVVRWLVHLMYTARGRRDGRRGLPDVSGDGTQPTPALRHLADEIAWEADLVVARAVSDAAATRVALAKLTAAGGGLDRENQRLQLLIERRDAVVAEGPQAGRRLGEEELPESFVLRRRQREHQKLVRKAAKKVEDQRTALSKLAAHEEVLRAQLAENAREVEAQLRLVGADRRAEASCYLNGAVRTHRHRARLMTLLPVLMPSAPGESLVRAPGTKS